MDARARVFRQWNNPPTLIVDTAAQRHHHYPNVYRRLATILLLAYQAVFLNAFLPGHTRGAITVNEGAAAAASLTRASCCLPPPVSHDPKHTPTPADRAGCVVCHLATHYTPPPATELQLRPLGLTQVLPPSAPDLATPTPLPLPYHGRAPPAFA